MQKNSLDTNINDPGSSFLDTADFVPIATNWRKKYYLRVFKKRVVAFLLDIFFIPAIFCIVFISIVFLFAVILPSSKSYDSVFFLLIGVFVPVAMFIVLAKMESSKWKGTVGKRIMRIQITDNYGNPISFWRALWRNILKVLVFFSYFLIIPAIIQYFTFKKIRKFFHDSFSKTIIGERL